MFLSVVTDYVDEISVSQFSQNLKITVFGANETIPTIVDGKKSMARTVIHLWRRREAMADLPPLRPVMTAAEISQVLTREARGPEFSNAIVYLPSYMRHDGTRTNGNGHFQEFDLGMTYWGTPMDDWHLDEDTYVNDHGSPVKSVYVTFDGVEYYESFLYCRIRPRTAYTIIHDVLKQLNSHLDMYVDNLRLGIAQEWAAQEPYRILPQLKSGCIHPVYDENGQVVDHHYPQHDVAAVMMYQLPKGYDEELPANDVI